MSHPYEVDPTLDGFDFSDDPALIRGHFPFVTPEARFMKHVRCAGYMNVQKLGQYLMDEFKRLGGKTLRGEVTGVTRSSGVDVRGPFPFFVFSSRPIHFSVCFFVCLRAREWRPWR